MNSDKIKPFSSERSSQMNIQTKEINGEIEDAIQELNFEKADELYKTQLMLQESFVDDQETHYQEEINRFRVMNDAEHDQKIAENEEKYEKEIEACNKKYSDIFDTIAKKQKDEIARLKEEWEKARAATCEAVNEKINKMLETARGLARAHKYQEAIQTRDKALAMKDTMDLPEIVQINDQYKMLFSKLLERHRQELSLHHTLYQQELDSILNSRNSANAFTTISRMYEESKIPQYVMRSAVNEKGINNDTKKIISMVSPRSANNNSKTNGRTHSSAHETPRSPCRLGFRENSNQLNDSISSDE